MKFKIWTCVITAFLAAVLLKYYAFDYRIDQESAKFRDSSEINRKEPDLPKPEIPEPEIPESEIPESEIPESEMPKPEIPETEMPETETSGELMSENSGCSAAGMIRVLIRTGNFSELFHEKPEITGDCSFRVEADGVISDYFPGEVFAAVDQNEVDITPEYGEGTLEILNLQRAQEHPCYKGKLHMTRTDQGYVIINELPLEEYLPFVLSSEMSEAFPMEALKAQAVCARTYALKKMLENDGSYYGADLDDSVSFQVYNNLEATEPIREAVLDTAGLILTEENDPAELFYFSTSCGATDLDSFSEEKDFRNFLENGRETDLEYGDGWYRWKTVLTAEQIRENLIKMNGKDPGRIAKVRVAYRMENGQVKLLEITGTDETVSVEGEYDIRCALAPGDQDILLKDGSICSSLSMLPSAWFVIDSKQETEEFTIRGGGYGHGVGMSQNGAGHMAENGADCKEILAFYYPDMVLSEYDG